MKKPRGFAAMDRKLVAEIARKGGKAAHERGTAHEFTKEEAQRAGRKGGLATHARKRELCWKNIDKGKCGLPVGHEGDCTLKAAECS